MTETAINHRRNSSRRLLITAGPTHEPIDAVRFIGNRSSGQMGVALAEAAAGAGWTVTLLLGPTALAPKSSHIETLRFRTTADLQSLLAEHWPKTHVLVMGAAVADYRPKSLDRPDVRQGKLKRDEGPLTLELEPTPDLVAECGRTKRHDQRIIGFALEPRNGMLDAARAKLVRKGLDLIVANPLDTMDAPTIEATVLGPSGVIAKTSGAISKVEFAAWLLEHINAIAPMET